MCYSYQASIRAWTINIITSMVLVYFNPVLGIFFLYIGLMQAFDAWFWTHPDNLGMTQLATVINVLQPFVLYMLLAFTQKLPMWAHYMAAGYLGFAVAYMVTNWSQLEHTRPKEEHGSLYWSWNYMWGYRMILIYYFTVLLSLIYIGFEKPLALLFAAALIASYVFSYGYYKGHVSGRFWCHWGSYIPLIFVAYYLIQAVPFAS